MCGLVRAQHVTPHDSIPDFCPNPTIMSVQSGRWSSASTWSPARLPAANDSVLISGGTTVTFDRTLTGALNAVCIEGTLQFDTSVSTLLWAANITVDPSGALLIGSSGSPVPASVKAEIVIANRLYSDPGQYGTGFISLGKVSIHGAAKRPTFLRVAAEPLAGQNTLVVETAVTGWKPGDRLVLPDTRHMKWNEVTNWTPNSPQWEELTIQSISSDGKTLTLTTPLRFDHRGARDGDGVLDFLPHVGNLTRNVIIRSESPIGQPGTKGHVLFTHRADIDVRYAAFRDLGRTTIAPLNDTTNHIGRYALHAHHLMGPVSTPANGYQYTLIGNAIDGGSSENNLKWGVAIHNSHYGLVKDNFAYNFAGGLFVTEDGSESYNLIEHNFAVRSNGTGGRMAEGTEGTGFWFRGPNNYVRSNVAANVWGDNPEAAYGYKYFMIYLGNIRIPNFKGADTSVSGQYTVRDGNKMNLLEFTNNEVHTAAQGLTYWWLNSQDTNANPSAAETLFKDFSVWHVFNVAVYHYQSAHLTFDNLRIRGATPRETACCGVGFLAGDYTVADLLFRNIDIQGMILGIRPSTGSYTTQEIENSYMRNLTDIRPETLYNSGGASWLPPRHIVIRNVRFDAWPGSSHRAIDMDWNSNTGPTINTTQLDEVLVYGFQGNPNDNFRAYYSVQATQNVAGGLAPCTTTRPDVDAITCPIPPESSSPPPPDTVPPAAPLNLRVTGSN
jgi:hypothetical protein